MVKQVIVGKYSQCVDCLLFPLGPYLTNSSDVWLRLPVQGCLLGLTGYLLAFAPFPFLLKSSVSRTFKKKKRTLIQLVNF